MRQRVKEEGQSNRGDLDEAPKASLGGFTVWPLEGTVPYTPRNL